MLRRACFSCCADYVPARIMIIPDKTIVNESKFYSFVTITSAFSRAVARHSAPRARPGDAESTKLSAYRIIRPFTFEFCAWVLAEHYR